MKSKEEIENGASSFGKILFKKPVKKENKIETSASSQEDLEKKTSEIDLIFNLDKNGAEIQALEKVETAEGKILLNEENKDDIKYGLQEPPVKKRYIDGPTLKVTSKSASKVLALEAKCDKKLLSFYDEEEELNNQNSSDEQ